ncbi:MAG: outer membrane protein assembly factor BamA, partial [Flavobacteriales bacterium]|nr:outer membrane protein assembly factor BamA [Flavobacteriales bacterium]
MLRYLIPFLILNLNLLAQNNQIIDYSSPKKYEIGGVTVTGVQNLNKNTLLEISGLKVGEEITIPSDKISSAIKNLWKQGLFSDVDILIEKIIDDIIFLNINIKEQNRLSKFKFKGKISKSDINSLKEELNITRGDILTKNLINNSVNKIKEYFINKGFYKISVNYLVSPDTLKNNYKNLTFTINKGKKVKIKNIIINGRKKIFNTKQNLIFKKDSIYAISDFQIRKSMKETKKKNAWRFYKASKFIEQNFINDKKNIIKKYNEIGYRDARITYDTVYLNQDNTLTIEMNISEGEKYSFGKISFTGNTVYTNEQLNQTLAIKSGDVFDQSILEMRLFGSGEGNDLSSLYLDDGYLFFNATPVETSVKNKKIDLEIRIYEGKQARINKVNVKGNTKTNDHVIMRELRTRPGDLFKRSDIMRSQRELAQMQYFDPEAFDVKIDPDPVKNEVNITYILEEKSSDQIQLQGGWGAGRIVGQLGFTFNNFSTRNVFKKDKWDPLPSGDGQKFNISASSNGIYYQQYRMSFLEPWLG